MRDIFTAPSPSPFAPFTQWLEEARASEPNDAEAMALASYDKQSDYPNVRMVLLKSFDERGFVFHTNMESQKGIELKAHQYGAACFHWKSLRRQLRLRGAMAVVDSQEADSYFATRSRRSRIGAWASQQSRPLEKYSDLQNAASEYEKKYADKDVPRPPHWQGFRLMASEIEFWQDGADRLHHRLLYKREGDIWHTDLLYP